MIFSHLLATQPHAPPSRRRPLRTALADRPVVLLHGARQTGKTTLVRAVAEDSGARYVTLDDLTMLSAARSDPAGFLAGFAQPLVLDEVQRAPDLLLAIKAAVDRKRTPGRFLLTGSANVLLLPQMAESLAGRMEIVNLWPFSQGEIEGAGEEFIAAAFGDAPPALSRRPSSDPLTDTGLAAHLMGIDDARLADDRGLFKYPGTLGHIRVIWFEGDPSSIRSRRFPA